MALDSLLCYLLIQCEPRLWLWSFTVPDCMTSVLSCIFHDMCVCLFLRLMHQVQTHLGMCAGVQCVHTSAVHLPTLCGGRQSRTPVQARQSRTASNETVEQTDLCSVVEQACSSGCLEPEHLHRWHGDLLDSCQVPAFIKTVGPLQVFMPPLP